MLDDVQEHGWLAKMRGLLSAGLLNGHKAALVAQLLGDTERGDREGAAGGEEQVGPFYWRREAAEPGWPDGVEGPWAHDRASSADAYGLSGGEVCLC